MGAYLEALVENLLPGSLRLWAEFSTFSHTLGQMSPCICWLLAMGHSQLLETTHFIGFSLLLFKASTSASNPCQASFCCISLAFCFAPMLKAHGNTLGPRTNNFGSWQLGWTTSQSRRATFCNMRGFKCYLPTSGPVWNNHCRTNSVLIPVLTYQTKWT